MKSIQFLFLSFLFSFSLIAREVTFLPTHVVGEEPLTLKKKDNLSTGVSELIGYYANENFLMEVSDFDKLKSYLSEEGEVSERKPSRSLLNGICEEFSSDYIVKSEINFEGSISIFSEVYNCRGKVIASNESVFSDNFYFSIEKHTKKTLNFLVPKPHSNAKIHSQMDEEIIFFFDLSGSLTSEIKVVVNYIQSIIGSKNLAMGAVLVGTKSIKIIKPSFNHSKLKDELNRIRLGGDVGLDKVTQGLVKARSELGNSKFSKRKFIIITDAKTNSSHEYGYLSAVQMLKEIGFNPFIITGSFFDYKSMNLHKKVARSSGNDLQQITHFQKVGTTKGYKTIYLNDRNVYYDESLQVNPKNLDLKEFAMLDEGSILAKFEYPHPNNMSAVYEKISGQRLIEKQAISSNTEYLVEKLVQGKSDSLNFAGSKVLIKSGNVSFWLTLSKFDESFENQNLSFQAVFVKDAFNGNGFVNIPSQTKIVSENIPKLLVLEPAQIRNFLKTNPSFTCFVSGKILEIK